MMRLSGLLKPIELRGGLALLLALFLLFWPTACSQERKPLQLGNPAPDFSAVDQHGETFTMSEMNGRPVVLRFWSVDCKYCRADTPVFNDYYQRYRDQGLMIVYISRSQDREMVSRFIEELGIEFPVLFDSNDRIAEKYQVKVDPQAIFFDPQHRLVAAMLGGVGAPELQRQLGPYLQLQQTGNEI